MRTGAEYLAGLRDGRNVYLDGERVAEVAEHPAFRPAIQRIATMYDSRLDDPDASAPGDSHGAEWSLPTTVGDLGHRRRAHRRWAEGSYGLMGRTPDHVASVLTAFAASSAVFGRGGQQFADNVIRFHARMRDEDAYVAYAIVPPQIDRGKPAHQQPEPFLHPGVRAERDDGIVVRGAQMIATGVVMADWLLVSYITPLFPGDEDYAISVVIPVDADGLRIHPRRPYASMATSSFDYPLSSRFDESDSLIVLDDVFVPWEHVFIYRNLDVCRAQFVETGSHQLANFQSLVRYTTKLDFVAGLARKLATLHSTDVSTEHQASLGGQVAAVCAAIEALTMAAESTAESSRGWMCPNGRFVYAGMSMQRRTIVDLMRALREMAGGAFIAVPSSVEMFTGAETAGDAARYYRSVSTPAEERVRFLKLMWDFVGTEFAGRQLQYEMFYSAAQHVVDTRLFKSYGWDEGVRLVDDCLAEAGAPAVSVAT